MAMPEELAGLKNSRGHELAPGSKLLFVWSVTEDIQDCTTSTQSNHAKKVNLRYLLIPQNLYAISYVIPFIARVRKPPHLVPLQ
jgi:hypothetical protein